MRSYYVPCFALSISQTLPHLVPQQHSEAGMIVMIPSELTEGQTS